MTPSNDDKHESPIQILTIGGTTVRIFAPVPMTDSEREIRHNEVVKAVARCMEKSNE